MTDIPGLIERLGCDLSLPEAYDVMREAATALIEKRVLLDCYIGLGAERDQLRAQLADAQRVNAELLKPINDELSDVIDEGYEQMKAERDALTADLAEAQADAAEGRLCAKLQEEDIDRLTASITALTAENEELKRRLDGTP